MSLIGNKTKKNIASITRPRVTEKSTDLASAERAVYVFEVSKDANKTEIMKAVKEKFGVTPVKVNIINLPAKKVVRRGKRGVVSGVKKALVYMKKGDKIELV